MKNWELALATLNESGAILGCPKRDLTPKLPKRNRSLTACANRRLRLSAMMPSFEGTRLNAKKQVFAEIGDVIITFADGRSSKIYASLLDHGRARG